MKSLDLKFIKEKCSLVEGDRDKALMKEKDNKIVQLKKELIMAQERFETALSIKNTNKISKVIRPIKGKSTSETVAVQLFSDWHIGEVVTWQSTNGKNVFNSKIAKERINKLFSKCLDLINMWRIKTNINTLVIGMLGDFVSGNIHEENEENNEMSPIESVKWLLPILRGGIQDLLDNGKFDKIIIPCCVGNHSRITKKRRISTEHDNSLEYLMYCTLAMFFENDKRVQFLIPKSYHNFLQVFDYKLRFHHGTAISYMSGVGGISVPINKYVLAKSKRDPVYLDVIGHFHQTFLDCSVTVNGSLIGYNPYADQKNFVYEDPKQTLFCIEKNHGITSFMPVILK